MTLNKVFMLGKLTRDVVINAVGDSQVATINIAVNLENTNSSGKEYKETCYIDVKAWGKLALKAADFLRKGDHILVTGRLRFETWKDKKTNEDRIKHTIFCEDFSMPDHEGLGENLQEIDPQIPATPPVQQPVQPSLAPQPFTQPVQQNKFQTNYTNPNLQPRTPRSSGNTGGYNY